MSVETGPVVVVGGGQRSSQALRICLDRKRWWEGQGREGQVVLNKEDE